MGATDSEPSTVAPSWAEPSPLPPSPPMPSSPSTKKDTTKNKMSVQSAIVPKKRLKDDDDDRRDDNNAEQSHCAQRLPPFKTVRIQEAMSFAKTPVRHHNHELNQIHYNRLFRLMIS